MKYSLIGRIVYRHVGYWNKIPQFRLESLTKLKIDRKDKIGHNI